MEQVAAYEADFTVDGSCCSAREGPCLGDCRKVWNGLYTGDQANVIDDLGFATLVAVVKAAVRLWVSLTRPVMNLKGGI